MTQPLPPPRRVSSTVEARTGGGISVRIPFDPLDAWGDRDAYHVAGTLGGHQYRGALGPADDGGHVLRLGPAWCRHPGFGPGDVVELVIGLEGPQSTTMGADVAAAFEADAQATRFFDSMPSYFRKNAARWIEAAKRPETRARRIADTVDRARRGQREG